MPDSGIIVKEVTVALVADLFALVREKYDQYSEAFDKAHHLFWEIIGSVEEPIERDKVLEETSLQVYAEFRRLIDGTL